MKKILIFSTAYLPLIGGAEIAVKELTDRLVGFDFDLITARLDSKLAKKEKIGRITIHRVGLGCKPDKFLLPILGLIKAIQLNKKNNYKIIWSIMASQASIAAALLKIFFSEKKLVLNLQEGDEEEHLKRYTLGNDFLYKILIHPWHLLVFKKADYITAISADLKDRAKKNGAKATIEVIPNGVDLKKFKIDNLNFKINELKNKLNFSEKDKIIITVSRLVKKNGIEDLIEAMSDLSEDVKLIIIGEGELRDDLKSKISNLKLYNRVIMLGAINNEIIPEYLAIADIFVRPSLSEGQGIAFLEAMAAGVLVVATPVGGIIDFLHDNETGLFCEVKNPKSIAGKIKILLEDKEKAEKITIVARTMVEKKYNWDLIAKSMENVFNKDSKLGSGKMKILIATGIYPPDIGGPATYAYNLSRELRKLDCDIKIISYSSQKNSNQEDIIFINKNKNIFLRYFYFFRQVNKLASWADMIYTLDLMSAGFPAVLAAILKRKKVIFRTGGDFLWEKAYQKGWTELPLSEYYKDKKNFLEKLLIFFCRQLLGRINFVIFSTEFQAKIYKEYYKLPQEKIKIIANASLEVNNFLPDYQYRDSFIFAGRLIKLKNLNRLIKAFSKIKDGNIKLIIFGQGPEKENLLTLIKNLSLEKRVEIKDKIEQEKLINIIGGCKFFILPSVTEISPNLALECLSLRKPIILTKETGLADELINKLVKINPMSEEDIKNKIEYLMKEDNLSEYKNVLDKLIIKPREWRQIAEEHLNIFKTLK